MNTLTTLLVALTIVSGCAVKTSDQSKLTNVVIDQGVSQYVFFGRDRERISDQGFIDTPAFVGAQLTYAWKELESEENVYDFAEIEHDLEFLKQHGKQLFIQLQDTTFNPQKAAVPQYLRTEPRYEGGVVFQYDDAGQPEGLVAMRWHPAVQEQFHKLLTALGGKFDGKIAGINLQETSIGVSASGPHAPAGFTYPGYRDAILANMTALKRAFPTSVAMQYANFMPGEWLPDDDLGLLQSVFQHGREHDIAVGAPDLMPKKPNQQNHAYRFMSELKTTMKLGVAVQDGNYTGTTGNGSAPDPSTSIVPDLAEYATHHLGVQYIFWGAQEPYFSRDVVPYFRQDKHAKH